MWHGTILPVANSDQRPSHISVRLDMIRSEFGRLHSGLSDLTGLTVIPSVVLGSRPVVPPPRPTRHPNSPSSLDSPPRYCAHEAVTEAQSLVYRYLVFVGNRIPFLPPRRPIGANY